MADKHPYVSGTGGLVHVLDHLKKSFPATLDADVLKRLGFAPKNESYVLNTVRFLKLIDDNGARTEMAQKTFTLHDTPTFQKTFADIVKSAYADLFSLHGDTTWALDSHKLITFFRQTDQSSEVVGKFQANTFKALAAYAGHVDALATAKPRTANRGEKKATAQKKTKSTPAAEQKKGDASARVDTSLGAQGQADRKLGLTVRIEINLPAQGDQETYDRIFKSIRENLLNG